MEQLELERVERGAPFVNDGLSMFSGVEWGYPTVILLLIFLTVGILSIGLIFFWLRTFKLYIPRSELYNEEYIKASIKNITAFRRYILLPAFTISTAIVILGAIVMILYNEELSTNHSQLIAKIFPFAFIPIGISLMCLVLGRSGAWKYYDIKDILDCKDIMKDIDLKRSAFPQKAGNIQHMQNNS